MSVVCCDMCGVYCIYDAVHYTRRVTLCVLFGIACAMCILCCILCDILCVVCVV